MSVASLSILIVEGRFNTLRPMVFDLMTEASSPSDGIYYCVRLPSGWELLVYRFDQMPETDHTAFWEDHVAPYLAVKWRAALGVHHRILESKLKRHPYAFPRGRVARNSIATYKVYHGNDLPVGISKKQVNSKFGLPEAVAWETDSHEVTDDEDRSSVYQLLKLTKP